LIVFVRVNLDEKTFKHRQALRVTHASAMGSELARVEVYFVDGAPALAFFSGTPPEQFCPFVVGRWRLLYDFPKSVVVMKSNERYAKDVICHREPS